VLIPQLCTLSRRARLGVAIPPVLWLREPPGLRTFGDQVCAFSVPAYISVPVFEEAQLAAATQVIATRVSGSSRR